MKCPKITGFKGYKTRTDSLSYTNCLSETLFEQKSHDESIWCFKYIRREHSELTLLVASVTITSMKITFVGLSCFLIENASGDRLLLEPYYDSGDFALGIKFPHDLTADVFLVSHPDEDHSYLHHSMLRQRQDENSQDTALDNELFPGLHLKGTLVREYNGDSCIAFSFTVDGIRLLHLADNAHVLSNRQLEEIGDVDVLFATMPKGEHNVAVDIIKQINPRLAIPSHYIPVCSDVDHPSEVQISREIKTLFQAGWMTGPHRDSEKTHSVFTSLFQNALDLHNSFGDYEEIEGATLVVDQNVFSERTKIKVFRDCVGKQITT